MNQNRKETKKHQMSNEDASSGGFVGFIVIIVVIGFLYALLSPIPDAMVNSNNVAASGNLLPISQDRINTTGYLAMAFGGGAFLTAIAAGINYWVNSMRGENQEV
jgi:hypothetical protein